MSEEVKEIIEIWKSLNIEKVLFKFDCGGDSMNETDIEIINTDGDEIENEIISNFFDNSTYDHIEFYVNSGDSYQGEFGTVVITFNPEEADSLDHPFCYFKDARENWSEAITVMLTVTITDQEKDFLTKYVKEMTTGNDSTPEFNYSRDFVLTSTMRFIQEMINEKIEAEVMTESNIPEVEDGVCEDYWSAELKTITGNFLNVEVSYSFSVVKDTEI